MHEKTPERELGGQWLRQKPSKQKAPEQAPAHSPAHPPVLLDLGGIAELMGVSIRTVQKLRHETWWPSALVLGARCLRWNRDEVVQALAERAPRVVVKDEPQHLQASRIVRNVTGRERKAIEQPAATEPLEAGDTSRKAVA